MSICNNKDVLPLNSIFIRGLLSSRKFHHRIEVKPKFGGKIISFDKERGCAIESFEFPATHRTEKIQRFMPVYCPLGEVGNRLYVKESWSCQPASQGKTKGININYTTDGSVIFVAEKDYPPNWQPPKTRLGLHLPPATLPKQFCRFVATIVAIKAERVAEISREDAIKEGIESQRHSFIVKYKDYLCADPSAPPSLLCPIDSYLSLCEHLHGSAFVARNPFVWVVSFDFEEIVSCTK